MVDTSTVASRIIANLGLSDPELDTSIGSVTRKIIDAVAEQIASVGITQDMLSYRFDIDSKHGADLDDFVALFGFSRLPAGRATGTVTLFRPSPAPQSIYVPAGTQVGTASTSPVVFGTVAPAYMAKGTASVEIPVQAVIGGEGGNLPSNSLTVLMTSVEDISSGTTNVGATQGGTNEESDEALISRFKRTVFRSLAGTEDMYLGVALEAPANEAEGEAPTQANVVGVAKKWSEQIQIEDGVGAGNGVAYLSIPNRNAKYYFEDSFVLGPNIAAGQILTRGVHYEVDMNSVPPRIISLDLEVGGIYDLEFEYTSSASRNDPGMGISNRVDVWTNGEKIVSAGEAFTFTDAKTFNNIGGDPLHRSNFIRLNTANTPPAAGSVFSQLSYGPIHSFPDLLSIAGVEYREGVDYFIVHDDTAFGYGPTSRFGIEWVQGKPHPNNGVGVGLSYFYNRTPRDVEARIRRWRLVSTDARAHAAKTAYLTISLAVMYDQGSSPGAVDNEIFAALSKFMSGKGFASVLQISDILHVVNSVNGVDAARMTHSADGLTPWGITEVTPTGIEIRKWEVYGRPVDVRLRDDQIPAIHNLVIHPRAQNTIYDTWNSSGSV